MIEICQDLSTKPVPQKEIAFLLCAYCQAKAKMIQLSKLAIQSNSISIIFRILDTHQNKALSESDLEEIMGEMEIPFI